ncbi:hypothetical protein SCATT_01880 [Streptantibioticus cattleyicolor NRRL 8057 = DSM 46488]|uniref:Uncharacterized protein n=1 Tax=Streptantibioticus cattleyicolor (strain ATCC 35852 / DSM 46488 / JCM 4925 / NBRC 14057 / NRRL 8057) TaxID=1003195 RepID=G8X1N0_STREN|nr:hypothetical protein SCATT_01880 [Streptantibioticus cattleyicolor NRRL 8057 = DSM 46488]
MVRTGRPWSTVEHGERAVTQQYGRVADDVDADRVVKGNASNDDDRFQRFCVQERVGGGVWRTVTCARGDIGMGGSVDTWMKTRQRGTSRFRGAFYEDDPRRKRHLGPKWLTPTVSVRVR